MHDPICQRRVVVWASRVEHPDLVADANHAEHSVIRETHGAYDAWLELIDTAKVDRRSLRARCHAATSRSMS